MDTAAYITRDPHICGGQPVFRGTRVLVRTVLLSLAEGDDVAKVLADFPTLTQEHLRAALAFAADRPDDDPPHAAVLGA